MALPGSEIKISNPPKDVISRVRFEPQNNHFLLVTSWDCKVSIYDYRNNTLSASFNQNGPVLDGTFQDSTHVYAAGLDMSLHAYDIATQKSLCVGQHMAPIRCVEYASEANLIVSGSWDATVRLWDPRTPCFISSTQQSRKVYAMDVSGEKLIVGTSDRRVVIWDLRNMAVPLQKRDSSLKYQTRCIRASPTADIYVLSSIEGRVAVDYIDPSRESQEKKYAFKCHRIKGEGDVEYIYPVNAIGFHKQRGSLATGGSDGFVNIWDWQSKKRLCQFKKYPTSVSSIHFSADGQSLAVACSYMDEQGDLGNNRPVDSIFVRHISDSDVLSR